MLQLVPITSPKKPGNAAGIAGHILMTFPHWAERQMRWSLWCPLVYVLAKIKVTLFLTPWLVPKGKGWLQKPMYCSLDGLLPALIWLQETAGCGSAWDGAVFKGWPGLWSKQREKISLKMSLKGCDWMWALGLYGTSFTHPQTELCLRLGSRHPLSPSLSPP